MAEEYEQEEEESSSDSQDLLEIHEKALRSFNLSVSQSQEEREQCLEDRRFYSIPGAQWEGKVGELFKNKPQLEVNKVHSSVIRIFNEYRANRITVDYISRDGVDRSELADTCDRLYRADEQKSQASEAYDNSFEEAVGGGMGTWRYRADLEDEFDIDNEYQSIYIEPIYDADSCVFFNADAMRQDKSDARECWVLIAYTHDYYKDNFDLDFDPAAWPKEVNQSKFDWCTPDKVYIAEYYKVEIVTEEVLVYVSSDGEKDYYTQKELDDNPSIPEQLALSQFTFTIKKKRKRKQIHKYLMGGDKIIEDCGIIAGTEIPIVPMYGKRWIVDGIERVMGHIRLAKDIQRIKNSEYSKLFEISALSSVEKPIFTPEQMGKHGNMWAADNITNYPYLFIESITNKDGDEAPAGPLGYTKVPSIPPALAALLDITEKDMQDILINQKEGDKLVSNISGEAIERVMNRLDMQSFIYMSNFAKAMRRGGQIWLSMAKDIYRDKGRKMMALGKEKSVDYIELMKPIKDEETGKTIYKNDFRDANFEIMVDVGPSFSSRKAKIVRELTEVLQMTPAGQNQETAIILTAMIMMNLDGEGMQEIREYYRWKLIKLGVVQPSEEEQKRLTKEAQNLKPDANEEYLKAAAENERAKSINSAADTKKKIAEIEKILADVTETLANIDREDAQAAIDMAAKINQSVTSGNQLSANQTVENTGNQPTP